MPYDDLVLGFRFGVFFFAGGIVPNPFDIRFQRVSGLGATINTIDHREGGQNAFTHKLPDGISHENIVFERGMVVGSPLNIEFNIALSFYSMVPSNVLIMLFDGDTTPLGGWLCIKATLYVGAPPISTLATTASSSIPSNSLTSGCRS